MRFGLCVYVNTFDNREPANESDDGPKHPLFAMEDELQELRTYLTAQEGKVIDEDLALNISIYLQRAEEAYLTLRTDVIHRMVDDHNFRTPSLN